MSKDYSRLKRRLKTAIKEGKAFNPPVLLGDTGKRAACLAWAGNVIDMLNNSDLGNEPHHLAVGGRGSLVIALEDKDEEFFEESRAEIIAAAESGIRVIEEKYEDQPIEPPKSTRAAAPTERPSSTTSEYNLTQNQKDLAQWIVRAVGAGKLKENFIIRWLDTVHLPGYSGELDEQEKALFTRNNIYDLRDAGLLRVKSPNKKRFDCAVRGKIYNAVDTDFGAVAKPERPSGTTSEYNLTESQKRKGVFISYSRVDAEFADSISSILDELNIDYFRDVQDIKWGDFVTSRIHDGIRDCVAILVIISPASLKSQWVPYEIGHATAYGSQVLLFLTHPALDLPIYLQDRHYLTRLEEAREFFSSTFIVELTDEASPAISSRDRAQIVVDLAHIQAGRYRLTITNEGDATARNVEILADDEPIGHFFAYQDLSPVKEHVFEQMSPKNSLVLRADLTSSISLPSKVHGTFDDDAGGGTFESYISSMRTL